MQSGHTILILIGIKISFMMMLLAKTPGSTKYPGAEIL